jgi:cyanophycin synthetase
LTHNGHLPVRCADLHGAAARRLTGRVGDQPVPAASVRSLLASVAVAWALGVSPQLIEAGLETFDPQAAA